MCVQIIQLILSGRIFAAISGAPPGNFSPDIVQALKNFWTLHRIYENR